MVIIFLLSKIHVIFKYFFVVVRCSTGRIVSQKLLKDLMREKVQALDAGTTFKVSNGWIVRFCPRFRLTPRRITGSSKKLPRNAPLIVDTYLRSLASKIHEDRMLTYNILFSLMK